MMREIKCLQSVKHSLCVLIYPFLVQELIACEAQILHCNTSHLTDVHAYR
jgi:hypothetical protein